MNSDQNAKGLYPYQRITEKILDLLDKGVAPWRQTWRNVGQPRSVRNLKPYRGVNWFTLGTVQGIEGYTSPLWITYKQAEELGGHVKKGEKGTPVVFWKMWTPSGDSDNGDTTPDFFGGDSGGSESGERKPRKVPFLRLYTVFNVCQCEGLDVPDFNVAPADSVDPILACEQLVEWWEGKPAISHNTMAQPCYCPTLDIVSLPPATFFESASTYYNVLFHELTHSTGHEKRLARSGVVNSARFASHTYSQEELVAEMGAAFLSSQCGIERDTLENSAAYLDHWRKHISADPKLVVIASAQAQKAVDMILGAESKANASEEQSETLAVA